MKKASKPIKEIGQVQDLQEYLKYHNVRDFALFVLAISTGFRMQDLVDLKVRDIQKALKDKEISIVEKKRERNSVARGYKAKPKARVSSLQKNTIKVLRNYIENMQSYDYAFPSQKGGYISVDSYGKILKKAGLYFRLDNIGAHTPRKIYAYNLYINSGKNIELVRLALGHSSTLITERYLGIDRDAIAEYSKVLNDLISC